MVIIESVLGNLKDSDWQARAARADLDGLVLNQWDAQKNRFRKLTEQGMEIAVSLERIDALVTRPRRMLSGIKGSRAVRSRPANSAVSVPITATISRASGARKKIGFERVTM